MAKLKRDLLAKVRTAERLTPSLYRGFLISGRSGMWMVGDWKSIYPSKAKAEAAVDTCIELRAELAVAQ